MKFPFDKIIIRRIPHQRQRALGGEKDVGDYLIEKNRLEIRVSREVGFWESWLIGIHELIEALIVLSEGKTIKRIDRWEAEHSDKSYSEIGLNPKSPIHRGHMVAKGIEHILALIFKVDWKKYEEKMDKLLCQKHKS